VGTVNCSGTGKDQNDRRRGAKRQSVVEAVAGGVTARGPEAKQ
jgi:hypothetical protein